MHRSFAYENGGLPTNERLEFLGDSVLGLIVTDTLFRKHPDLPEGQLAKLRAAVVNMRALAGRRPRPAPGLLRPAGQGRGGHGRPGQVLDPRRHARGRDRRRLPGQRPGSGRRAGAPAVRPGDRQVGPARRRAGLEDLAAGAHRRRGPRRARVPRRGERARPPEVVPRRRRGSAARSTARARAAPRRKPSSRPPRPPGPRSAQGRAAAGRRARRGRRTAADRERPPPVCAGAARRPCDSKPAPGPSENAGRSPCPSCPRSRPSGTASSGMSAGRTIADGRRCCIRARRGGTWPARRDLAAVLQRPDGRRRPAARQVPVAAGRRRRAARPPGHERPAAGRRAGPAAVAARPGPVHVHRRRPRPALRRPAHVRPPGLLAGRRGAARRPSRTSRPTRSRRPSTTAAFDGHGCATRRTGIKRALLDQSLISGVGNIYADEALWRARLHWARADRTRCAAARSPRLLAAVREVFAEALQGRRHLVRQPVCQCQRARAGTSTGRWPSTAGRASPARAAAPRSGATRS